MGTFKNKKGYVKVELIRSLNAKPFVLKIDDEKIVYTDEGKRVFCYTEEHNNFFHSPLVPLKEETLMVIKKVINGHAFQGGIKNSFHVVRKESQNSITNEGEKGLLKESIREAFVPFSEMKHKNQPVRVVRGIKFIDDSSSVNVNAAWFSLEINDGPIIWIMGGLDFRNNDYQIIFDLVKEKVKALVFLGKKTR